MFADVWLSVTMPIQIERNIICITVMYYVSGLYFAGYSALLLWTIVHLVHFNSTFIPYYQITAYIQKGKSFIFIHASSTRRCHEGLHVSNLKICEDLYLLVGSYSEVKCVCLLYVNPRHRLPYLHLQN